MRSDRWQDSTAKSLYPTEQNRCLNGATPECGIEAHPPRQLHAPEAHSERAVASKATCYGFKSRRER